MSRDHRGGITHSLVRERHQQRIQQIGRAVRPGGQRPLGPEHLLDLALLQLHRRAPRLGQFLAQRRPFGDPAAAERHVARPIGVQPTLQRVGVRQSLEHELGIKGTDQIAAEIYSKTPCTDDSNGRDNHGVLELRAGRGDYENGHFRRQTFGTVNHFKKARYGNSRCPR